MIAVLVMLLLVSLSTQSVMQSVSQQAQREREAALLSTGLQYVRAIGAYYESSPGAVKRWPSSLEDLLEDKRKLQLHRHLRELYPDPVSRATPWELVLSPDGGIQGVRSRSSQTPIRSGPVQWEELQLPAASSYQDWKFVYLPAASPKRTGGAS
ncbi:type II secretion system protein [Rhodoferax mekongensis]|uniref:type II secretion system protein n=1 Tax=Rhodoferax mekongensis TaxID=3068341 RepID=UPI0028BD6520|nr:type II secretion system protein [Rhodoferax sp. TBRC 17199]MDT7517126.1 type II secretion system protein [Rhodoferax sp. TBRC 17199]